MTKFPLIFIGVIAFWVTVEASSNANTDVIYICDTRSEQFGCDPNGWVGGDRLNCQNASRVMYWASRPVHSDCFKLTAGMDEDNPVTSYEPNQILQLHLRVTCYGMLFRGLLLYAVNDKEQKVGDWQISDADPVEFKRPWTDPSSPCFGALMHASAEYKAYDSVLYFQTPPEGTGNITFRCLIKASLIFAKQLANYL
jgi:hypothetical protein